MDAPCFLAVDGGGTKTEAVLVDEQKRVVGRGYAGPSNYTRKSPEEWAQVVCEAVQFAFASAPRRILRAWIGSAGIESAQAAEEARKHASRVLGLAYEHVRVTNDVTLLCANLERSGLAVIAGTGSAVHVFGHTSDGLQHVTQIGGLGWILGDEGSAYGIGRAALRAVLHRDSDAENLLAAILAHWNVRDPGELISAVYAKQAPNPIASLAPLVCKLAFEKQDTGALRVVTMQAQLLAAQIARGATHCSAPYDLCLGGKVLMQAAYRRLVLAALASQKIDFAHVHILADVTADAARSIRVHA